MHLFGLRIFILKICLKHVKLSDEFHLLDLSAITYEGPNYIIAIKISKLLEQDGTNKKKQKCTKFIQLQFSNRIRVWQAMCCLIF